MRNKKKKPIKIVRKQRKKLEKTPKPKKRRPKISKMTLNRKFLNHQLKPRNK